MVLGIEPATQVQALGRELSNCIIINMHALASFLVVRNRAEIV